MVEEKQTTEEVKEIKRFQPNLESAIIRALDKFLPNDRGGISEELAIKQEFGVMDAANVCMVVAVSEEARRVLSRFAVAEGFPSSKVPVLEYGNVIGVCKYSVEYLSYAISLFKCFEENGIQISIGKEHPGTWENKHFRVIIAPRINTN